MRVNIGPFNEEGEHYPVDVVIERTDIVSLFSTLALIVLPLLKKFRASSPAAPVVEDADVPENIRSTAAAPYNAEQGELDEFFFVRWEYVIDQMIFSFEQITGNDEPHWFPDDTQKRIDEGLRLFGKYYMDLWD